MNHPAKGEYRSAVYTSRPDYADFDAPSKFQAIRSIVARRLIEHPRAILSYSGGSDSDILLDVVEGVRREYGLTRTGCCGCHISYKAVEDLDMIRPFEPNLVKAAWAVFGDSYRYRQAYNAYKAERMAEDRRRANMLDGQIDIWEVLNGA